jgi:hypothetical protein
MAVVEIKNKLGLEISEDKLINLTKLAIPEKIVEILGETTLRTIS